MPETEYKETAELKVVINDQKTADQPSGNLTVLYINFSAGDTVDDMRFRDKDCWPLTPSEVNGPSSSTA